MNTCCSITCPLFYRNFILVGYLLKHLFYTVCNLSSYGTLATLVRRDEKVLLPINLFVNKSKLSEARKLVGVCDLKLDSRLSVNVPFFNVGFDVRTMACTI